MKKIEKLTEKEMANIIGGKYYGNGLYCGKHSCSVDGGKATTCIINNGAMAWATGGHQGTHKC
ncbi:class II bacteriocin [Pediococcus parvulus]|uniref:class II bacteriocin n=1 Tax=Pediococcus parvulus TaxID=54062 RepID=UPI0021A7F55F|nr:class II bacteriocin [Pediococcus parvulus]MCT3029022.1 bacteriocin [Pediococcus parvulus]